MNTPGPLQGPTDQPVDPPISTRGIAIGMMVLGVLFVAFAFWANAAGQRAGAVTIPLLQLVEPRDGSVLTDPVVVVFEVEADLRRGPGGWSSGRNHLHAMVGGRELMPGPTDVERLAPNRYRWTFPSLPAGDYSLFLFWADMQHRPAAVGASPTVRIQLR